MEDKINSDLIKTGEAITFFDNVARTIEEGRRITGHTINLAMCATYYEIGRQIVEEEQGGKARAEYGRGLIKELSGFLTKKFGRGFSLSTLKNARQFYNAYAPIVSKKAPESRLSEKSQTPFGFLESKDLAQKSQTMFAQSYPFVLSWSHYLILMRVTNEDERHFYEIEAAKQQWTYQWLQRQYGSS